jgi:hypothetical protein
MIESHVIKDWIETHHRLSVDSEAMHDSQAVAFGLLSKYDQMNHDERKCIFSLLSDWLLSDDNCLRYDAAFLISQRKIRELIPGILKAISKYSQRPGPESYYETQKLKRIFNELECC